MTAPPGPHLDTLASKPSTTQIHLPKNHLQTMTRREGPDKESIGIGFFAPQSMVEVGNDNSPLTPTTLGKQQMQQCDRIRASGHPDHQVSAWNKSTRALQSLSNPAGQSSHT